MVFVLLKAMTLIPLALGVLGLKAFNALQLSFFSFVASIALAIFQLCKKVRRDDGLCGVQNKGVLMGFFLTFSTDRHRQPSSAVGRSRTVGGALVRRRSGGRSGCARSRGPEPGLCGVHVLNGWMKRKFESTEEIHRQREKESIIPLNQTRDKDKTNDYLFNLFRMKLANIERCNCVHTINMEMCHKSYIFLHFNILTFNIWGL